MLSVLERKYHPLYGFFQESRTFLHKHTVYNSINRISSLNIAWGNSCQSSKMRIFRLQKRACRVILDYRLEKCNEAIVSKDFICL